MILKLDSEKLNFKKNNTHKQLFHVVGKSITCMVQDEFEEVKINNATEKDLDWCCKLIMTTMKKYHETYTDSFDIEWFSKKFIDGIKDTRVLQMGSKNIGFFEAGKETEDSFFLSELHIAPEYQGQGLGSSLLEYIDNIAKQNGAISISMVVYKENPAVNLYLKHGYVIEKESNDLRMRVMKKRL